MKVANPCLSNGAGKHRGSPRASAQETQFQVQVRGNGGSTVTRMAAPEERHLDGHSAAPVTSCNSARVTQVPGALDCKANGLTVTTYQRMRATH